MEVYPNQTQSETEEGCGTLICSKLTMKNDEIKRLIAWLRTRVNLAKGGDEITIIFDEPGAGDFPSHGFDQDVIGLTLEREWWAEMATDIVETPTFAEPDQSAEQVLAYARDVVSESFRKRLGT